jgi:hypothetical protein
LKRWLAILFDSVMNRQRPSLDGKPAMVEFLFPQLRKRPVDKEFEATREQIGRRRT